MSRRLPCTFFFVGPMGVVGGGRRRRWHENKVTIPDR